MFEQALRAVLVMLVVATFTWYTSEVSFRYTSRFSFSRMVLSLGSMLVDLALLMYIVAPPDRDIYIQTGMEAALVIGATLMATGVVAMPIVKWRQRRKHSV